MLSLGYQEKQNMQCLNRSLVEATCMKQLFFNAFVKPIFELLTLKYDSHNRIQEEHR